MKMVGGKSGPEYNLTVYAQDGIFVNSRMITSFMDKVENEHLNSLRENNSNSVVFNNMFGVYVVKVDFKDVQQTQVVEG